MKVSETLRRLRRYAGRSSGFITQFRVFLLFSSSSRHHHLISLLGNERLVS